jgi:hypothetical protein
MSRIMRSATLAVSLMFPAVSTEANVITDWDATAVSVTPPTAAGLREMAIMHVAMFDAVNSIARRYRPYMAQPWRQIRRPKKRPRPPRQPTC